MNTAELEQNLLDEGCNPSSFAIGLRGGTSDAFCLMHDDNAWQVFYTERGADQKPIYRSNDEAEACAFFFRHITSFRHPHLAGFFRDKAMADDLLHTLKCANLNAWQDAIHYRAGEWRHRVFVEGKDIFVARQLCDAPLPLQDET
jgi:hypothetical protein